MYVPSEKYVHILVIALYIHCIRRELEVLLNSIIQLLICRKGNIIFNKPER